VNIARLVLVLILSLHTGSSLCMKTLVNDTADEVPFFTIDYARIDQEFYDAVTVKTLEPLKEFCRKCATALATTNQRTENLVDPEKDQALLDLRETAEYAYWWLALIRYEYDENRPYWAGNVDYFPHCLIINYDSHYPIDNNPIARLAIIWPHMEKNNGAIPSSEFWEFEAGRCRNPDARNLILNGRQTFITSTGAGPATHLPQLPHQPDTPPHKQTMFSPKYIAISLACCIACLVGVKKCYDWYVTQPISEDENDEPAIA